jgi:hypothetical protein
VRIDVICAALAGAIAWQSPPATQAPKKEVTVQLRGCLKGQTLTLTEDPGFDVPGKKVELKGDRRLMRALREHDGHLEEIVGVLNAPVLEVRAFTHLERKCH